MLFLKGNRYPSDVVRPGRANAARTGDVRGMDSDAVLNVSFEAGGVRSPDERPSPYHLVRELPLTMPTRDWMLPSEGSG